ncbi:hypothetical protein EIP91_011166 [Steccherinum ochraceum]|uniref:FAD dependent oxidoreductase domain-containing protein n=1 Tax=Steccherinum ochraceum TaxID=92696 RepID=A0A4V2MX07_9APHY|nr:hypothetical protein EIP91_011166 [Steccherinum ochraceum]
MSTEGAQRHIVILGAGVIGMTIAHVISTRYPSKYKITIVARDMPEDFTSQAFASPWAGANWSPFGYEENSYRRELATFNKFWDMQLTGLVHVVPYRIYIPAEPTEEMLYFKELFKFLPPEELPEGMKAGVIFDTITVNPEQYLPWLRLQLLNFGVTFVRRKVQGLDEAADLAGENGIIVNATGLGAKSLIGVEDEKVYPIRGQTIIVHAPGIKERAECFALPLVGVSSDDVTYAIPRPSPDEHVLIGGTYQKHNWDTSVDFTAAQRMWDTAVKYMPALKSEKNSVIRHNVGLRPAREGGARIEVELVSFPVNRDFMYGHSARQTRGTLSVVHAYGFGGTGYQCSWGAAEEAVDLIQSIA